MANKTASVRLGEQNTQEKLSMETPQSNSRLTRLNKKFVKEPLSNLTS